MNLLAAENIAKSHGIKTLFDDISFGIEEGEKIGLIGVNGTGKSTLLKILSGLEPPDQGKVIIGNSVRIEYLSQTPSFDDEATVLQQVFRSNSTTADFWEVEGEAKTVLTKLGISDFDVHVGTLSGGQRKRVALAAALINSADLLILDEPTNHIDNDTVAWLEQYLNRRKGALLMITHDRYFLDRVVNRIIELDRGRLYSYSGNYSKYLELKLARDEQEKASEQKRLNLLRNELQWIRRGAKARTTKQKARIERFEKLKDNAPAAGPEKIDISVGASRLGKKVLLMERISKAFGGKKVLDNFSDIFLRDDRVGIIGPNGVGKSTLLNIIAGVLEPDSGTVEKGLTVKVGYFSQENRDVDNNIKVIDYIKEQAEYISTSDGKLISAAQMLERFLFPGNLQWVPIGKLSGGEKRRLFLLRVLMGAPNVLLLDEPTNDLDIQTLTILEDYLDEFPGVVIAVSHDRYFLDRVVDRLLCFEEKGSVRRYVGGYTEYLEQLTEEDNNLNKDTATNNYEKLTRQVTATYPVNEPAKVVAPVKLSYKEQKEFDTIEEVIAGAELELDQIKARIANATSDFMLLQELLTEQERLEKGLDELLERWAYLNEMAEEIEKNKRAKANLS